MTGMNASGYFSHLSSIKCVTELLFIGTLPTLSMYTGDCAYATAVQCSPLCKIELSFTEHLKRGLQVHAAQHMSSTQLLLLFKHIKIFKYSHLGKHTVKCISTRSITSNAYKLAYNSE